MIVVTVMYPAGEPTTRFDLDYYLQKHLTLLQDRWGPYGLDSQRVLQGVPAPDGSAPTYRIMALLTFKSLADFKNASKAHGREIMADLANFTNAKPVMQINNVASECDGARVSTGKPSA